MKKIYVFFFSILLPFITLLGCNQNISTSNNSIRIVIPGNSSRNASETEIDRFFKSLDHFQLTVANNEEFIIYNESAGAGEEIEVTDLENGVYHVSLHAYLNIDGELDVLSAETKTVELTGKEPVEITFTFTIPDILRDPVTPAPEEPENPEEPDTPIEEPEEPEELPYYVIELGMPGSATRAVQNFEELKSVVESVTTTDKPTHIYISTDYEDGSELTLDDNGGPVALDTGITVTGDIELFSAPSTKILENELSEIDFDSMQEDELLLYFSDFTSTIYTLPRNVALFTVGSTAAQNAKLTIYNVNFKMVDFNEAPLFSIWGNETPKFTNRKGATLSLINTEITGVQNNSPLIYVSGGSSLVITESTIKNAMNTGYEEGADAIYAKNFANVVINGLTLESCGSTDSSCPNILFKGRDSFNNSYDAGTLSVKNIEFVNCIFGDQDWSSSRPSGNLAVEEDIHIGGSFVMDLFDLHWHYDEGKTPKCYVDSDFTPSRSIKSDIYGDKITLRLGYDNSQAMTTNNCYPMAFLCSKQQPVFDSTDNSFLARDFFELMYRYSKPVSDFKLLYNNHMAASLKNLKNFNSLSVNTYNSYFFDTESFIDDAIDELDEDHDYLSNTENINYYADSTLSKTNFIVNEGIPYLLKMAGSYYDYDTQIVNFDGSDLVGKEGFDTLFTIKTNYVGDKESAILINTSNSELNINSMIIEGNKNNSCVWLAGTLNLTDSKLNTVGDTDYKSASIAIKGKSTINLYGTSYIDSIRFYEADDENTAVEGAVNTLITLGENFKPSTTSTNIFLTSEQALYYTENQLINNEAQFDVTANPLGMMFTISVIDANNTTYVVNNDGYLGIN